MASAGRGCLGPGGLAATDEESRDGGRRRGDLRCCGRDGAGSGCACLAAAAATQRGRRSLPRRPNVRCRKARPTPSLTGARLQPSESRQLGPVSMLPSRPVCSHRRGPSSQRVFRRTAQHRLAWPRPNGAARPERRSATRTPQRDSGAFGSETAGRELVRARGLEPPPPKRLGPKPSASAVPPRPRATIRR